MRIIEILKVIVLGMVEGFTEWLPISSTGHLILINQLIHLDVSPEFMEMFRVVIQLGAILAVVMLYFDRLNPLSRSKRGDQRRVALTLWSKIIVACIPAAILGKLLDDWMDAHLYNGLVVSIMLAVYGVLCADPRNLAFGRYNTRRRASRLFPRGGGRVFLFCRHPGYVRREPPEVCKIRKIRRPLRPYRDSLPRARHGGGLPGLAVLDTLPDELG